MPGDLLTDLYKAGLIGDPIRENNFRSPGMWHNYTWTYSTTFSVADPKTPTLLVFDGTEEKLR